MQRKPSYYLKQSVATVLAAAAGLVVGLQIETNQATTRKQRRRVLRDAGLPRATRSSCSLHAAALRPLQRRLRGPRPANAVRGIQTECIYV